MYKLKIICLFNIFSHIFFCFAAHSYAPDAMDESSEGILRKWLRQALERPDSEGFYYTPIKRRPKNNENIDDHERDFTPIKNPKHRAEEELPYLNTKTWKDLNNSDQERKKIFNSLARYISFRKKSDLRVTASLLKYDRYQNVLPSPNDFFSQNGWPYLNASLVDLRVLFGKEFECNEIYVATQAPLVKGKHNGQNDTTDTFFSYIWLNKVSIITNLTNFDESTFDESNIVFAHKSEKYWPEKGQALITIDGITIETLQIVEDDGLDTVKLKLSGRVFDQKSEQIKYGSRIVYLLHYKKWKDDLLPEDITDAIFKISRNIDKRLLELKPLEATNDIPCLLSGKILPRPPSQPLFIHCSAGLHRTGTFIFFRGYLQNFRNTGKIGDFVRDIIKFQDARIGGLISFVGYFEVLFQLMNMLEKEESSLK